MVMKDATPLTTPSTKNGMRSLYPREPEKYKYTMMKPPMLCYIWHSITLRKTNSRNNIFVQSVLREGNRTIFRPMDYCVNLVLVR